MSNNYKKQREQFDFNDSLTRTISLINAAKNSAISSASYYDGTKNVVPKEGYGVLISKKGSEGEITLFANVGVGNVGDIDEERTNQFDDKDGVIETYKYKVHTIFEKIHDENGVLVDNDNDLDVVIIFRPPLAETYIAVNDTTLLTKSSGSGAINTIMDLKLELSRREAPENTPHKFIKINKISGFPELEL